MSLIDQVAGSSSSALLWILGKAPLGPDEVVDAVAVVGVAEGEILQRRAEPESPHAQIAEIVELAGDPQKTTAPVAAEEFRRMVVAAAAAAAAR